MRILALEPYLGGSHEAFLHGWSRRSRHHWTIWGLPAYKWKWRMRHAAISFCDRLSALPPPGQSSWDLVFCSDMLNLAEFRGLASPVVARLPAVLYFHENQLTYPVREENERDYHFAFTNFTSALAADSVWFNSDYHRVSFLTAAKQLLMRMPDQQPMAALDHIVAKSVVAPPGVDSNYARAERRPGAMRILWAARWEHDKGPEAFFDALGQLRDQQVDFRLIVVGQHFRKTPEVFHRAKTDFEDRIDHWGYVPDRDQYLTVLRDADVIVSTAGHEFFGLSVVEAVLAGAYPLLPRRLSYPELLGASQPPQDGDPRSTLFFYDGDARSLAAALASLARRIEDQDRWSRELDDARRAVSRFRWEVVAPKLDQRLDDLLHQQT